MSVYEKSSVREKMKSVKGESMWNTCMTGVTLMDLVGKHWVVASVVPLQEFSWHLIVQRAILHRLVCTSCMTGRSQIV